jgi:hypothetical protein
MTRYESASTQTLGLFFFVPSFQGKFFQTLSSDNPGQSSYLSCIPRESKVRHSRFEIMVRTHAIQSSIPGSVSHF